MLTRVISALVIIPLVLFVVYQGGPWFALVVLLLAMLGAYEFFRLLFNQAIHLQTVLGFAGVALILALVYLHFFDQLFHLAFLSFFLHSISALGGGKNRSLADSALAFWGVIYIGGLFSYLLLLRMAPGGELYTFLLLIGVWSHDTLAYMVGVRWGTHKLAPAISPNKSVEGSLAGILGTMIIFFSWSILWPDHLTLSPGPALLLALGIAVFAQLGDLLESALKRHFSVKDSGSIMPGHGGVLDRCDSLMLAAPFVYYFFLLR